MVDSVAGLKALFLNPPYLSQLIGIMVETLFTSNMKVKDIVLFTVSVQNRRERENRSLLNLLYVDCIYVILHMYHPHLLKKAWVFSLI